MAYCAQLQKDFGTFRSDFDTIGKHLGHARSKYAEAEKRLDRFEDRLNQAVDSPEIETVELSELPRALDAA
jgi:DNA recombination protein RmuC